MVGLANKKAKNKSLQCKMDIAVVLSVIYPFLLHMPKFQANEKGLDKNPREKNTSSVNIYDTWFVQNP